MLQALAERGRDDVQVVAINDLAPPATNAHLARYASVHGRFPGEVKLEGDTLNVRTAAGKTLATRSGAARNSRSAARQRRQVFMCGRSTARSSALASPSASAESSGS